MYETCCRHILFMLVNTKDSPHISGMPGRMQTTLHARTIPYLTGIGPDERFCWLVVVLVGSCPSRLLGMVVLVGNS